MAAVVRCQMCQTENPHGQEFCRLCHARLPEGPPAEFADEASGAEDEGSVVPDWLSRLRQEVSGEPPPGPPPIRATDRAELDWLGEMPRVVGDEEGPPPGEVPDWVEDAPASSPVDE